MQALMWGACSCDREKLLWPPEFTSGTHAVARSWPSGQLSAVMARGGYRPGGDVRPHIFSAIPVSATATNRSFNGDVASPSAADIHLSRRCGRSA